MLENLNLQKIVLVIAIVSFILAVMVIYYKSTTMNQTNIWPPVITKCPDYWDLSEDRTLCVNTSGMNKGKLSYNTCNGTNFPCCKDGTCYLNSTLIENKKQWANKNRFVWDGITSG